MELSNNVEEYGVINNNGEENDAARLILPPMLPPVPGVVCSLLNLWTHP